MKYAQIFIFVFVILTVVVGLSFQEINDNDSSLTESIEIIEEGGKIIGVNLSDGVTGSQDNE